MTWSGGGPKALCCYFLDRSLVLLLSDGGDSRFFRPMCILFLNRCRQWFHCLRTFSKSPHHTKALRVDISAADDTAMKVFQEVCDVICSVARFRLRAHTLRIEIVTWTHNSYQIVTYVMLMMYRMSNISFSSASIHTWSLCEGLMLTYLQA